MNDEYVIKTPHMTIKPKVDTLDWVMTTNNDINGVYLYCSIGRVEVAGGWTAIESDSGFTERNIAEVLAENIQVCIENFVCQTDDRKLPKLKPEVFKGLSLNDIKCTQDSPPCVNMYIKVTVDCFLEVCGWLKEMGMNQSHYS